MKCIEINTKKQKNHYIMILPVTICAPHDMKSWLYYSEEYAKLNKSTIICLYV